MSQNLELSIVMPCLNEEKTIGRCVKECLAALKKHKIRGEVVVCNNGSTDKSAQIDKSKGARVIVEKKTWIRKRLHYRLE